MIIITIITRGSVPLSSDISRITDYTYSEFVDAIGMLRKKLNPIKSRNYFITDSLFTIVAKQNFTCKN